MLKTSEFTFVILHYLTIDDTRLCVESIKKNSEKYNYNIVIVDNGSNNGTGEQLIEEYHDDSRIKVIINSKNIGFANGNNIGFKYAKEKLGSDFIVLANNDTKLLDNSFISKVLDEYNTSKFSVLGPKIILKNECVNPISYPDLRIKILKKQLFRYKVSYLFDKVFILYYMKKLYKLIKKCVFKKKKERIIRINDKNNPYLRHEDILLHGCFLIFSKEYIDLFDGLNSNTFLYREEELLYKRLKDYNLKNVYNPNIQIFHNEDSATDAMTTSDRKKSIFINKNRIDSTKILIEEICGDKNEK